jgi:hypothetical protein
MQYTQKESPPLKCPEAKEKEKEKEKEDQPDVIGSPLQMFFPISCFPKSKSLCFFSHPLP